MNIGPSWIPQIIYFKVSWLATLMLSATLLTLCYVTNSKVPGIRKWIFERSFWLPGYCRSPASKIPDLITLGTDMVQKLTNYFYCLASYKHYCCEFSQGPLKDYPHEMFNNVQIRLRKHLIKFIGCYKE
jgi:hypothetical protein